MILPIIGVGCISCLRIRSLRRRFAFATSLACRFAMLLSITTSCPGSWPFSQVSATVVLDQHLANTFKVLSVCTDLHNEDLLSIESTQLQHQLCPQAVWKHHCVIQLAQHMPPTSSPLNVGKHGFAWLARQRTTLLLSCTNETIPWLPHRLLETRGLWSHPQVSLGHQVRTTLQVQDP